MCQNVLKISKQMSYLSNKQLNYTNHENWIVLIGPNWKIYNIVK